MAGEVSFVEFGVEDPAKGRAFYEGLFGWRFAQGPGGEGAGWTVDLPGVPAGMHGGDRTAQPYLFFRVDDLAAAVARVRALGGTVEDSAELDGDEASVARFGRFRMCTDDQGSGFGLHEPPGRD